MPVGHLITMRDGKVLRFQVFPDQDEAFAAAGLEPRCTWHSLVGAGSRADRRFQRRDLDHEGADAPDGEVYGLRSAIEGTVYRGS